MLMPYKISMYCKEFKPDWAYELPAGCPPEDDSLNYLTQTNMRKRLLLLLCLALMAGGAAWADIA